MDFELVIFDCDGVLVDSEMISARAFAQVLKSVGINMTPIEVFRKFKGGSMAESLAYVERVLGAPPSTDIEAMYRKQSFDMYRSEMQPVKGIETILQRLKLQKCVASNGPRNKIILNLEITRLDQYFKESEIYSAYDFNKWKPDPTMFLAAADAFKVDSSKCLVIGDSIADVKGAINAGMKCFAYAPHGDEEGLEAGGARVFDNMEDISVALSSYMQS